MFDVILLIAGKGSRTGLAFNKTLYKIDNKPLFRYPLDAFLNCEECRRVIIVTNKQSYDQVVKYVSDIDQSKISITFGGDFRQDSVANGIEMCSSEVVLIHDGARPLIEKTHILEVYNTAKTNSSSVLAVKTTDTIKQLQDGKLVTLNREDLWNIQTPQGLKLELYKHALIQAKEENYYATDDVSLLEKYLDISPVIVQGSYQNIKVTTAEDLEYIKYLFRRNFNGL